ncbi:MAG: hypothetical protein DRP01_10715 [Archaeoglobales archaeon]|nr:MAG: hypothetical protein DRP01_10715 [Archaeoglobales archaeon]
MMLALGKPVFILVKKGEEEKLREKIPSDLIWKRVVPYQEFIDIEDELAELVKKRPKVDKIPSTRKLIESKIQEIEDRIVERIEKSLRGIVREELNKEVIFERLLELLKKLGFDKIPKVIGEERRIEVSPSIRKTIEELIEIVGDYLPDDSETAIMMGNWYLEQKEYEKALKLYDWALKLDPNNADAWFFKGLVFDSMKKYEDALKCYDVALVFDPNDSATWNNKGWCLVNIGKLDEALVCFDKALEYDPNDKLAWANKGWCLKRLGRYNEALKCYDKALEIDPNFVDAWNDIGIIFVDIKRYDEAEECFKKALELDPKNITVIQNLSELYQIVGKLDEALKFAKKAIRLSKEFDDKAISRYLVITAYLLKGERRKAKSEIRNLIKYLRRIGDKFKPDIWDISPLLPTIDEKLPDEDRKIVHALVNLLRGKMSLDKFENF